MSVCVWGGGAFMTVFSYVVVIFLEVDPESKLQLSC